ncbi:MAG: Xaa-Pro dipeptidase [Proteobacteria bacterium]|nr:Xaa-Pro dipeptidase [Pseudomonadota bacterium]
MSKEYKEYYAAHVAEMQRRWTTALDAENLQAILVHSGTPLISFQDDYEYAFRPNPHFLAWLPLTHHHDSALLVRPGKKPCIFYYQPEDFWYLAPADPEPWWADHFDIQLVNQADGWCTGLFSKLNGGSFGIRDVAAIGDAPSLAGTFEDDRINPRGLVNRLQVERTRKTPYEIACMMEASQLAARAHVEAESAFREGESEWRIHQRYLGACEHTDAQLPYNNIVALNTHGSVLHYQGRDVAVPDPVRSFLIDAGCTVNAYASDITRTYAARDGASGEDGFAQLVAAMDTMQQGLIEAVRTGLDYRELHLQAHREIAGILESFDLIKVPADDAVATGLSSVFYPHGLGHFIGLQTHDVSGLTDNEGRAIPPPEGHPFLRLTRVLEAGNVLTIEPGLYFIEPLLRQWQENGDAAAVNWDRVEALKPYGGIRIEDNVVVTETGSNNLTRQAFATL